MTNNQPNVVKSRVFRFADVFAGCGGLSLGLTNSGWEGRFAIEKNKDAFNTFEANLLKQDGKRFSWPHWLPQEAHSISDLLKNHGESLAKSRIKIDLLAGGPPCQGFSMAGRRVHSDPRNRLVKDYIRLVQKIKPRFLLLENVQGFDLPFTKSATTTTSAVRYSEIVAKSLRRHGYEVFSSLVDLSAFGVPQTRKRFILIAIQKGDPALKKLAGKSPFDLLQFEKNEFLHQHGFDLKRPVSVRDAISDLQTHGKRLIESKNTQSGFLEIKYKPPKSPSPFISLMREGMTDAPDSLRLPRHKASTVDAFRKVQETCVAGKTVGLVDRQRLGIKKHALTPLDANSPAATVTTLPDDMIHYSEPRVLTVRENARLQTFPDWFNFLGKYTTGGKVRKIECPRYTQVGNAVPPLFAEIVGRMLKSLAT